MLKYMFSGSMINLLTEQIKGNQLLSRSSQKGSGCQERELGLRERTALRATTGAAVWNRLPGRQGEDG